MQQTEFASVAKPRTIQPVWPGLIFGFLLVAFLGMVIYVTYSFLAWGRLALTQAPSLPPLALPKLVRPAAETSQQQTTSGGGLLFRPATGAAAGAAAPTVGRTTILLMGVDARAGEAIARTDTIIVLTINPQAGASGMLSIPRDLKVFLPVTNRDWKITSVYPNGEALGYPGGGAALLEETVEELLGYPIDYYVRINFEGFQQIIDLIGGIDIDVPKDIIDHKYPTANFGIEELFIPKGRQHMDGALALKYARTRHADSDYARAGRQQQVIIAVKDRLLQSGQLESLLPRLPRLTVAMANTVQTNLPMDKAIALARLLHKVDLSRITRIVIDQKMGTVVPDDLPLGYVLVPDFNKIRTAADAIFADATASTTPEEQVREAIAAEAARIVILNGAQVAGLAAKTQVELAALGYKVINIGAADRADYVDNGLVVYGEGSPMTLDALIRHFNVSAERITYEPERGDIDFAVILGAVQATPTPAP